jgi:hypothetical protein
MFLPLDMDSARIYLFFGFVATHNQRYSGPALIAVSSTMSSEILFLFGDILLGDISESSSRLQGGFS